MFKLISCASMFRLSRIRKINSENMSMCLATQFRSVNPHDLFSNSIFHSSYRLYHNCEEQGNCTDSHTFDKGTRDKLYRNIHKMFKCSQEEVDLMIKNHPMLLATSYISQNLRLLHEQGLSRKALTNNPWILKCEPSTLQFGLKCIKNFHEDINMSVPMLQIPLNRLEVLSNLAEKESEIIPEGNRIRYLYIKLRCSPSRICKVMASHLFLQRLPFSRLDAVLQFLLDAGVSTENILNDVWVFRYNPDTVQERMQRAKEAGIKCIKPWVVRCPEDVFTNMLQRNVESRISLGKHPSVLSYLSQRLNCDLDDVAYLGLKTPQLLKVNVPKLEEMLDFLYEEGFTPQQVYRVPRILCHSLDTVQSRLWQLRDLGYNPSSLIVLCRSKRQYSEFVMKLASRKTLYY